mgnify:FL=1
MHRGCSLMKSVIAAYRNIKALIRHHCFLFTVIILSVVLSSVGIFFYSGYFLYSYYDTVGMDRNHLSIQLQDGTQPEAVSEIIQELTSTGLDQVRKLTAYDNPNMQKNGAYTEQSIPAVGVYDKEYEKRLLLGRFFTIQEDAPYVVLSEFMTDVLGFHQSPIGSNVHIGEDEFKVIGMISHSDENGYLIPIQYYINHFPTASIEVTYGSELSRSQLKAIRTSLSQNVNILSCKITSPPSPFLSSDFMLSFLQIILIFCAAFINIISMLYFWNRLSRQTYQIYSICGSSPGQKFSIILMQTLALMVPSVAAGFLLFTMLLPTFGRLNLVYAAHIENYLLIGAILMIIVFCASILLAVRNLKEREIYIIKE